jgi:hypothetical protein
MSVEIPERRPDLGRVWAICWPMRLASIPPRLDTALAENTFTIGVGKTKSTHSTYILLGLKAPNVIAAWKIDCTEH